MVLVKVKAAISHIDKHQAELAGISFQTYLLGAFGFSLDGLANGQTFFFMRCDC